MSPTHADIAWFDAGTATVGTDRPVIDADGEGPARKVGVRAYGMDRYAVTNARFARFVAETGHVTDAERFGWSFVFKDFVAPGTLTSQAVGLPWWHRVAGASWRLPGGPGGSLLPEDRHPVVHVSWNDAQAFAGWAGGRLPSEPEWEHAAKAGQADATYPWGNDEPGDRNIRCNIWQGRFPHINSLADGYAGTAPVDAFEPNPAGIFNMCGNVWEWCADMFHVRSLARAAKERNAVARKNAERLLKGGSYLCHISYCFRYRIAARMAQSADTSTGHIGFRLAYDRS
jgi:formylglycine-generating enzyme required for sulfatase activity